MLRSASAIGAAVVLAAAGAAAAPAVRTVPVKMLEFKFDPKAISLKPGKVVFDIVNTGVVEHNFVVPARKVSSGIVKPGQTKKLELTLAAGRYELVCDIPGHKEAGMVGTITVK
jgi:uncharacterized cupredoxin-like copper-binding protein